MSTDLTVRNMAQNPVALGEVLAASGFFQDSRGAAQAAVKVMAGQEMGFGPVASMTGVYIVKGRVTISANLMAAAIKRHPAYTYRVREHTDTVCVIDFIEDGEVIGTSSFSWEDAKKGGLTGSATWKNYPRNMLFARALSNGAKWYCPDVFGGPIYTPDELGAEVDGESGQVVNAPQVEPTPLEPAQLAPGDKPLSDKGREKIAAAVAEAGLDLAMVLGAAGFDSLADVTSVDAAKKVRAVMDAAAPQDDAEPVDGEPVEDDADAPGGLLDMQEAQS